MHTPGPAPTTRMPPVKTILVVEDELKIARLVRDYLEQAGYSVLTAPDGESGLALWRSHDPELVVLDLGLPGMDGYDIARTMRRDSMVPIIMLTARTEETDKIVGLELGADDYVTKPFSPRELVARVRALLRRVDGGDSVSETIRAGEVEIDVPKMRVTVGERTVDLTPTEFEILKTLAASPGRIYTRSQLLDVLHGISFESYERAIDAHIKNLRRKLEPVPGAPQYVLTVYGVGYRFADA